LNIKKTLNVSGKIVDLKTPKVMGIINTTPDSFYASSRYQMLDDLLAQTESMLKDGASILDIGGYSTRPGNTEVSEKEELHRVINPIKSILKEFPKVIVSIDTFRAKVAEEALQVGASMVNDISGGHLDKRMFEVVGQWNCPYIMMHMRGHPREMMSNIQYEDLITEITKYFTDQVMLAKTYDIHDIILDPGFGFSKNIDQNYELLKKMDSLKVFELPILAGLSRKSMIYKKLNITSQEALNGTSILNTVALVHGASILRVHDVKQAMEAVHLFKEIYK